MKPPVLLRIFKNGQIVAVRQFTETQIVGGSNDDLQLTLDSDQVAPLHFMIEDREGVYYLSDLGSGSGTFKGDTKVIDEALASGDEFKAGDFSFQFFVGVPKPTAPPKESTVTGSKIPESVPDEKVLAAQKSTAAPASSPVQEARVAEPAETPTAVVAKAEPTAKKKKKPKIITAEPQVAPEQPSKDSKSNNRPKAAKGTYAPPSTFRSPLEFLRPTKGSCIEVMVAWQERVLFTGHFSGQRAVTLGGDTASDIYLPIETLRGKKAELIKIDGSVYVRPPVGSRIEVIKEKGQKSDARGNGERFMMNQGEIVQIHLYHDLVTIFIRFVPQPPHPIMAPLLDLSTSEITGVILAFAVASIMGIYMAIYSPDPATEDELLEEKMRRVVVNFQPPKKLVEITDKTETPPVPVKEIPKELPQKKDKPVAANEPMPDPGKAAALRKSPQNKTTTKVASQRQGGAIKTGKAGASAESEKRDVNKMGLLSVFGSKGTQQKLDTVYSGAGELTGIAATSTGFAGQVDAREGDQIGSALKADGSGGQGKATVGISGVGTKGRGTGTYGYGTGGLNKVGSVDINIAGQGAVFEGTIDREAIKRVIQNNIRAIRDCYNRALNKNPDLYGKIVLEWEFSEGGRVTAARPVSDSTGTSEVASCIIGRLKTWTFPEPPPDQRAVVRYPFVFSSE